MATDIIISFDTTGSMSVCIGVVRAKVAETIDRLFSTIPELRIGIIAHGDYCDGKNMYRKVDLTDNQQSLVNFVKHVPNTNGGDYPEFYEYILQQVRVDFEWQADNKILIFIADAPLRS